MEQYISKAALVAEIERRLNELYDLLPDASKVENGSITMSEACNTGKYTALESFKDYIETLEVKEVDLDFTKEVDVWVKDNGDTNGFFNVQELVKHFFELGMQASNPLTWEDMMTIHKCCKDAMNCNLYAWETAEGQQKIYEDVLKRFKELKNGTTSK